MRSYLTEHSYFHLQIWLPQATNAIALWVWKLVLAIVWTWNRVSSSSEPLTWGFSGERRLLYHTTEWNPGKPFLFSWCIRLWGVHSIVNLVSAKVWYAALESLWFVTIFKPMRENTHENWEKKELRALWDNNIRREKCKNTNVDMMDDTCLYMNPRWIAFFIHFFKDFDETFMLFSIYQCLIQAWPYLQ